MRSKVRCLNEIEKEEAKIIAAEQPAFVAETGNYGRRNDCTGCTYSKSKEEENGQH